MSIIFFLVQKKKRKQVEKLTFFLLLRVNHPISVRLPFSPDQLKATSSGRLPRQAAVAGRLLLLPRVDRPWELLPWSFCASFFTSRRVPVTWAATRRPGEVASSSSSRLNACNRLSSPENLHWSQLGAFFFAPIFGEAPAISEVPNRSLSPVYQYSSFNFS